MASQWSGDQVHVRYGKDCQGCALAVDCLGKWAVLAGRRLLTLIDLDNPKECVHKISRQSKWDINCVRWNPHASHAERFMTACHQRVDLFSWRDGTSQSICSLKAHSRAVSDLDWSPFDVNIVASCSTDSYTYLWDIRDYKKPVTSFHTVAGASNVQWNKVTNNLFATTHESDVRVWDPRKANQSVQYIAAHLSKIHGLDWSPSNENTLVTSSQDSTVRFWNIQFPRRSEGLLNQGSPVWRARYTPFGQGMVTVVVPQIRRAEHSLYLWNVCHLSTTHPVHTFVGHTDVVLEFQWRKQQEGSSDFQLVTWSKDQSLRIWKVDTNLQKMCGHVITENGEETEVPSSATLLEDKDANDSVTEEQKEQDTFDKFSQESYQQPQTLQQEFALVNLYIPNVTIEEFFRFYDTFVRLGNIKGGGSQSTRERTSEIGMWENSSLGQVFVANTQQASSQAQIFCPSDEMDALKRSCKFNAISGKHTVTLKMEFPNNYPNIEPPSFKITNTTLNEDSQKELLKTLAETSSIHVERRMNSLEPCLRAFQSTMDSLTCEERHTPDAEIYNLQQPPQPSIPPLRLPYTIGNYNYQDRKVPFPRTSGARFCSAGYLVCFGIPAEMKKVSKNSEVTPKALSDLAAYAPERRARSQQTAPSFNLYSRSPPPSGGEPLSISNFFTVREKKHRHRLKPKVSSKDVDKMKDTDKIAKNPKKTIVGPTRIYDISCLLTVHKQLAENYIIDLHDIPRMCQHNAKEAAAIGRKDLVQLWSVISVITDKKLETPRTPDEGPPWAFHPCGRQLLKSLMDYYSKLYDVQTLAMLCCIFWTRDDADKSCRSSTKPAVDYVPANYNPYHTVTSATSVLKGWTSSVIKRSNSWSDSFEDYRFIDEKDPKEKAAELERELHENNCRMLDPALHQQYDLFKKAYADILHRWALTNQSAMVLKCVTSPTEQHRGVEFCTKCYYCMKDVRGAQCASCKYLAMQCVICRTGVRGATNFCLSCGHGGHTQHMIEWFKTETVCPSGCGCHCLTENPMVCL